ncbi:golgin-45-like [Uloborus diversus]|uniref:golgin-45-like n=1 Tax=Uloborus diversus TaxID=327109 RepID=UPI0024092882|nr:golgin-45-like [Uloborus diversus]
MENTIFNEREKSGNLSTLPKCYDTNFNQSGKRKEPKFIPYEPYKAATSPIVPTMRTCEKTLSSKCVIDSQKVNSLASSIIKFNSCGKKDEILKLPKTAENESDIKEECCLKHLSKIDALETKVKELEKDKKDLESQFNIQVKVNADLKKMLIASLGEDMELKVSYMTEDKARLGMNVLEFSEEVREKNEAIDRLSVERDVWKTKFEASSVMVNELAAWKKSISQKLNEAARSLNFLLKEHDTLFSQVQSCYW